MLKYKVKRVRCGYIVTDLTNSDVKNLTTVFAKGEEQKMINEIFGWAVELSNYGDEAIVELDSTVGKNCLHSELGEYIKENYSEDDVGKIYF